MQRTAQQPTLSITLHSRAKGGLRLTVQRRATMRSTSIENQIRAAVEAEVNSDSHAKLGPWTVHSSHWES